MGSYALHPHCHLVLGPKQIQAIFGILYHLKASKELELSSRETVPSDV